MTAQRDYDIMYMQHALALARKGWGRTSINPLVGAVIVKNNRIVGQGYHRKLREAHAEVVAITDAGSMARGATLYVNLEPCCCSGFTPPCVDAIIKAGISRVVVGIKDPNPLVNGNGITGLQENGIEVILGVLQEETSRLNRGYVKYITTKIPYVILKIAVSKNFKISGFEGKYITSQPSLRYVHSLRSQVCAVLVGINTVLKDDPYLTDRLVGRHNPARVVIDPELKIPSSAHFLKPDARRIIITAPDNDVLKIEKLIAAGAEIMLFEQKPFPLKQILEKLGMMQIGSLLVEGGGTVFTQVYNERLYDELYVFVAPRETAGGEKVAEHIVEDIQAQGSRYESTGEDRVYHVHRHN
jgi:diaminohydroxyphosphoribosylaminopyrimidine deaminase/5-amino-6-(5-phosphoribosylamino)uracil reductase